MGGHSGAAFFIAGKRRGQTRSADSETTCGTQSQAERRAGRRKFPESGGIARNRTECACVCTLVRTDGYMEPPAFVVRAQLSVVGNQSWRVVDARWFAVRCPWQGGCSLPSEMCDRMRAVPRMLRAQSWRCSLYYYYTAPPRIWLLDGPLEYSHPISRQAVIKK